MLMLAQSGDVTSWKDIALMGILAFFMLVIYRGWPWKKNDED